MKHDGNGDPVRGPAGGQETVTSRTLTLTKIPQHEIDALVDGDATIITSVRLADRTVRSTLCPVEVLRFHWPHPVAFRPTHVILIG